MTETNRKKQKEKRKEKRKQQRLDDGGGKYMHHQVYLSC